MRSAKLVAACSYALLLLLSLGGEVYAEVLRIPLYKLAPAKTVDLRCTSGSHSLQIPIAERWRVNKAVLSFNYVNSTGLLANKARMTIKVNDYPVAQVNLNPSAPEGSVRLSVPPFLLEPGYNKFGFHISQHYTQECEQVCAPELWTTLKLDQAFFEIDYTLKPVPVQLSSINKLLFDPKISPHGAVNIVLETTDSELVTIAGILASGIARRFDYGQVLFTVSDTLKPGSDNLLVGRQDFVQGFLKSKGVNPPAIQGPYLKILHLPGLGSGGEGRADSTHALLVVSGLNGDHLKLAAETFAIMSSSLPNSDEMLITGFTLPGITMYSGRRVVSLNKQYTFKGLDLRSQTFKGFNPAGSEVAFRLPADALIRSNVSAELSMYFSYGAALGSGSVLNIGVNGQLVRAIHLDNSKGDSIEGYKISIPTFMFKPGDNVIRFEPVLSPSFSKACDNFQDQNLFLTIFDNSTLFFPPMPHLVDLPRIELLMLSGFPFTRWPDGHESIIYLANKDVPTLNSALNLIGMITQKNGYPLIEMKVTYDDPKQFDGELVILGDVNTIPEAYKKAAPLILTKTTTIPHPVVSGWNAEVALAYSQQVSEFRPGKGVLMEFLSPFKEGRTVLLATAASTEELEVFSKVLLEPGVQAKSEGGLVLVDLSPPDYTVESLQVGKRYFSGKTGKVSLIERYLFFYPWLYYVTVAVVIIALGLVIFYILKRYRARRLTGATTGTTGPGG